MMNSKKITFSIIAVICLNFLYSQSECKDLSLDSVLALHHGIIEISKADSSVIDSKLISETLEIQEDCLFISWTQDSILKVEDTCVSVFYRFDFYSKEALNSIKNYGSYLESAPHVKYGSFLVNPKTGEIKEIVSDSNDGFIFFTDKP